PRVAKTWKVVSPSPGTIISDGGSNPPGGLPAELSALALPERQASRLGANARPLGRIRPVCSNALFLACCLLGSMYEVPSTRNEALRRRTKHSVRHRRCPRAFPR